MFPTSIPFFSTNSSGDPFPAEAFTEGEAINDVVQEAAEKSKGLWNTTSSAFTLGLTVGVSVGTFVALLL